MREIGVLTFVSTMLLALVSTLAITLVAVARQAWSAMRMMPSKALRI